MHFLSLTFPPKRVARGSGHWQLRIWLDNTSTTITALAAKMGLSRDTVTMWLSGRKMPLLPNRYRIQQATDGQVNASCWATFDELTIANKIKNRTTPQALRHQKVCGYDDLLRLAALVTLGEPVTSDDVQNAKAALRTIQRSREALITDDPAEILEQWEPCYKCTTNTVKYKDFL